MFLVLVRLKSRGGRVGRLTGEDGGHTPSALHAQSHCPTDGEYVESGTYAAEEIANTITRGWLQLLCTNTLLNSQLERGLTLLLLRWYDRLEDFF